MDWLIVHGYNAEFFYGIDINPAAVGTAEHIITWIRLLINGYH